MQTETSLIVEIRSIFSTQLSIEIPTLETDLLDTGLIDSLTMVDLLTHLETSYGFTVVMEDLDIEFFRTLKSIAEYVDRSRS
ncbi:MAG: acyl carrier protein [Fuerstiella sp.]|nr:acyl carrier protein [Fuerstiella sp.]